MKKKLLFLSILIISFLLMACANDATSFNTTTTESIPSTTIYNDSTTDQVTVINSADQDEYSSNTTTWVNRFVDNHILVAINHEDSLKWLEYTIEDFIIEDIIEIRDLTEGWKNSVLNDPTYDSSKFHRIFLLIIDYHDCDRVVENAERLMELVDFIESAGLDLYTHPSGNSNTKNPNK